jgi:hypothetical protein
MKALAAAWPALAAVAESLPAPAEASIASAFLAKLVKTFFVPHSATAVFSKSMSAAL